MPYDLFAAEFEVKQSVSRDCTEAQPERVSIMYIGCGASRMRKPREVDFHDVR
jgi:hypothetical protein